MDGGADSVDSEEGVALSIDGVDGGVELWTAESALHCRCMDGGVDGAKTKLMAWTADLMAWTAVSHFFC